ncbi:MAG: HypC/HybG/HupF family hydrogenase formation chaperone [Deltaproteobacteria bacterium]|nr:MAG: HypC/HybG/HupF family hydrogenase formation chaperone [Deltaproteobacteria bacterium]RKX60201.1 MAG: HypC/HybG/HupF family hydrogenase formation chaperone [Thermodesulfobacteriota bacterium]HDG97333.1 HypC/HybG/HupF family hydrogenase formation chaperone [Desulfobacterales bacterium]
MCLGIPGKVVSIKGDFAEVDFGGVRTKVSLLLSPDVSEGDYVLVHVGFAIQRLGQQEAIETLRLFKEIDRGYVDSIEGNG